MSDVGNGSTLPVPPSTLGKTVTLPKGIVVTDDGPAGTDGLVRRCVADDGTEHLIIARVIRELPVTHRRAGL